MVGYDPSLMLKAGRFFLSLSTFRYLCLSSPEFLKFSNIINSFNCLFSSEIRTRIVESLNSFPGLSFRYISSLNSSVNSLNVVLVIMSNKMSSLSLLRKYGDFRNFLNSHVSSSEKLLITVNTLDSDITKKGNNFIKL